MKSTDQNVHLSTVSDSNGYMTVGPGPTVRKLFEF